MRPSHPDPRPLSGLGLLLGVRLTADTGEVPFSASDSTVVTGVTHDSRAVQPGDLYAALPGSRVHGADFCAAAVTAGAVAVLTDPGGRERAAASGVPVF